MSKDYKEEINIMKLCRLCGFIDGANLHINDILYHQNGMHKNGNKTFEPLFCHKLYELHLLWSKLNKHE